MSGGPVRPPPCGCPGGGDERPEAGPGWNPPSAAVATQHYFDFGERESLCWNARDSGARAPYPDERYPICAQCLRIVRAIASNARNEDA